MKNSGQSQKETAKPELGAGPSSLDLMGAGSALAEIASAFFADLSSRKKSGQTAERADAAQDSPPTIEDRYRILVEQIPAVVFMAYVDGGLGEAYVSPYIEKTLGFSQEEWLDEPIRWYQQIHPDDRERWSLEAAETFVVGKPL